MKQLTQILKCKRAEVFVSASAILMIVMMMLVITVNVFVVFGQQIQLDYFSNELLDTAAAYGRIGPEVSARFDELCDETGLTPSVSWDASYYSSSKRTVQLADPIELTLTYNATIPALGDAVGLTIPLRSRHSKLSKMFWK